MLFERLFSRKPEPSSSLEALSIGCQRVPLLLVRNPRARRYLLRVRPDGTVRVTIPRGGSLAVAREFARHHRPWVERQMARLRTPPRTSLQWRIGMEILFRGENVRLTSGERGCAQLGAEAVAVEGLTGDLRPAIERHLRELAGRELPQRLRELAGRHGFTVSRVTVRNQRSRWGSCSRRGTVSLNWRLIQTPDFVRDYICLHELAHLREMNHSGRFWREIERLCPDYARAEHWLKRHSDLLRSIASPPPVSENTQGRAIQPGPNNENCP